MIISSVNPMRGAGRGASWIIGCAPGQNSYEEVSYIARMVRRTRRLSQRMNFGELSLWSGAATGATMFQMRWLSRRLVEARSAS
jgi:hypothetical protein